MFSNFPSSHHFYHQNKKPRVSHGQEEMKTIVASLYVRFVGPNALQAFYMCSGILLMQLQYLQGLNILSFVSQVAYKGWLEEHRIKKENDQRGFLVTFSSLIT